MKISERSYSTKSLRPKPQVFHDEDGSLTVIVTSWGQSEHATRALDEIVKYVNAAKSDVEVTSPFEFMTCLSDQANYLRIALMIANDLLYRGENRRQYVSGVEVLALLRQGNQVAWAQVGCPSLLIQRAGQRVQPLTVGMDLSSELSSGEKILAPLPAQLLGLDPSCNIQCGHTHVKTGDQLVLMASSTLAPSLWSQTTKIDFNTISNRMIQEMPDTPFWLGLIQIED